MASGYKVRRTGPEGVAKRLRDQQRQIDQARGAADNLSSVIGRNGLVIVDGGSITQRDVTGRDVGKMYVGGYDILDPVTGGAMSLRRGQIRLWDNYLENPEGYGRIVTDQGIGINYMRMYPPFTDGTGAENSFTLRGRTPDGAGAAWLYCDGQYLISASGGTYITHSTTSSSANAVLSTAGLVQRSTSSRRYKQNIRTAAVDPAEVLQLVGRTWRDRSDVTEDPETGQRYIGFIAEELDALPSLRQFVVYDEEGRPDAIAYDRLTVPLLSLAKQQEQRITTLEETVSKQDATIAALTARLDALEAATQNPGVTE